YIINIILFITVALISLPIVGYAGLSHTNHILILFYFFSIFLLPKELIERDYKYVQYIYLGILTTYSAAGFWKIAFIVKKFITNESTISWLDLNAAKINSIYNYYIIDEYIPKWMSILYRYSELWTVATIIVILLQTLC